MGGYFTSLLYYPYIQVWLLIVEKIKGKMYVITWLMNMSIEAYKWKYLSYTWRELIIQKQCQVRYYMFAKYILKIMWMFYCWVMIQMFSLTLYYCCLHQIYIFFSLHLASSPWNPPINWTYFFFFWLYSNEYWFILVHLLVNLYSPFANVVVVQYI